MRLKSLYLIVLIALAAATLNAQTYWSAAPPDCSTLNTSSVPITNSAGTTIGYSCVVSGTFPWLAAGAGWGSAIRVAAPTSAPIGVDISFYEGATDFVAKPVDSRELVARVHEALTVAL